MIKLLVLDVDGCMSNGKIIYNSKGEEIKSFDVKDGLAIVSWIRLGGKVAIITGRVSKVVKNRSKELGITHLYQGIKNKESKLKEILRIENIKSKEIAVIGDDLNDYKMLKLAGFSFAPKDAVKEIKDIADVTLSKNGGDGAIREMIEIIFSKNNQKEEFLKLWY